MCGFLCFALNSLLLCSALSFVLNGITEDHGLLLLSLTSLQDLHKNPARVLQVDGLSGRGDALVSFFFWYSAGYPSRRYFKV